MLICAVLINASQSKKVNKTFKVEPGKKINIESVSGMDVKVSSWDRNEVMVDVSLRISSSDDDFEKEYARVFDVIRREKGSSTTIEFSESDRDKGWSIWDIFKLKFHFSVSKEIKGEIYIPKDNPLSADFKYSDIELSDMKGTISLDGKGNTLFLESCENLIGIRNNYGDVTIKNSGGNLKLESRSSTVRVDSFDGTIRIDAPYSNIYLSNVTKDANVITRSASAEIKKVDGNLTADVPYSDLEVYNISGNVKIDNRSGNIRVDDAGGIEIDAPYTKVEVSNVTGKSSGEIKIKNKSGRIKLSNAVGNLFIDDSYSDMILNNISGDVTLTSRSSKIEAEKISGDWKSDTEYSSVIIRNSKIDNIKIDNRSNPVNIYLKNAPKSVDINNEYGSVDINMTSSFSGEVKLYATYGSIESNLPLSIKTQSSSSNAFGNIGNGNGKILIETKSGDIKLISR
jgi:hypothetical protein